MTALATSQASGYLFYHKSARLAAVVKIAQNKTGGFRFKTEILGNPLMMWYDLWLLVTPHYWEWLTKLLERSRQPRLITFGIAKVEFINTPSLSVLETVMVCFLRNYRWRRHSRHSTMKRYFKQVYLTRMVWKAIGRFHCRDTKLYTNNETNGMFGHVLFNSFNAQHVCMLVNYMYPR